MDQVLASLVRFLSTIDPIAFSIGPISVRWYGIAYIAGVALGLWVLTVFAKRWKISLSSDDLMTIALAAIAGILLGGRLGYCLFYGGSYYFLHPLEVFALWDGGMSFHGGLIGALIGGWFASRAVGVPYLTLVDMGAIGAPIGLFLGRMANFFNGELWGRTSDVAWAIVFESGGPLRRHPSQLYEALFEGIVLGIVLFALAYKLPPRPRGEILGWLVALYGVARFGIEFFREPDVGVGFLLGGWLTMGMLLSIPLVLGGIALIVWARINNLPQNSLSNK